MPIKCLVCNDPLLNEYITYHDGSQLSKSCIKKIDHHLVFHSYLRDHDRVLQIWSRLRNQTLKIIWTPDTSQLEYSSSSNYDKLYNLPYFEPDFSNYKKLIEKIKLYLTFS